MSRWQSDDAWQREIRNRFMPPVYKQWAFDGMFTFPSKSRCSTLIQRRLSVDTILQVNLNFSDCLEEKFVRWPASGKPLTRFFFETDSCTIKGHHSDGWMRYCEADKLLYAFAQNGEQELDAYLIEDFQKVKRWFKWIDKLWEYNPRLQTRYHRHTNEYENRSRGLLVPITDIVQVASMKRFRIAENGVYYPVPLPPVESPLLDIAKEPHKFLSTITSLRQPLLLEVSAHA